MTRKAWQKLFPSISLIQCFLHAIFKTEMCQPKPQKNCIISWRILLGRYTRQVQNSVFPNVYDDSVRYESDSKTVFWKPNYSNSVTKKPDFFQPTIWKPVWEPVIWLTVWCEAWISIWLACRLFMVLWCLLHQGYVLIVFWRTLKHICTIPPRITSARILVHHSHTQRFYLTCNVGSRTCFERIQDRRFTDFNTKS